MYYPNLKTSDAELRAATHLTEVIKRAICPIFELTRSRKTKLLPRGSLVRRLEQLLSVYGDHQFILDLCTQDELMNNETIELFDEFDGYRRWRTFLEEHGHERIIPCALYVEDGRKEEFQKQCVALRKNYGKICIRTSATDEFAPRLLTWASEVIPESDIILCGILYFIEEGRINHYKRVAQDYIQDVVGNRRPFAVLLPSSSFPRYITDFEGCEDDSGSFLAAEIQLNDWAQTTYPNHPIQSSDFASVHPIRYQASGGNWIPRIDIPTASGLKYVRVRRDEGGYRAAANEITQSDINRLPNSWGRTEIEAAKRGVIRGANPSYWISVRINCWISERAQVS